MGGSDTFRRRFLRTVSAAGLGVLAGCADLQPGTDGRGDERADAGETATPSDDAGDDGRGDDSDPKRADPELLAGIGRAAIPLETVDPDAPLDDLAPVAEMLDGARIIGMGEATHGTREFHTIRHRLVRKLVADHGLRAVAFEDNFASVRRINEYVRDGEGDTESAMDSFLTYLFHTTEVRRMIEWLRAFNEGRPEDDRVGVYGIDVQRAAPVAEWLRSYFERTDPEYLESVDDRLDVVAQSSTFAFDLDEDETGTMLELAVELGERLEAHEAAYVSETSASEWELARRHARVMEQSGQRRAAQLDETDVREQLFAGWEVRDRSMAENVGWLLDFEDTDRMAIWAHNSHLQRGTRELGGESLRPLGNFLDESYGRAYYPLGFTFGRGTVTARDTGTRLAEYEVETPVEGTVDEVLAGVEHPKFVLDFDASREEEAVATWLEGSHELQWVGSSWGGSPGTIEVDLARDFDGLAFVRETTATDASFPDHVG